MGYKVLLHSTEFVKHQCVFSMPIEKKALAVDKIHPTIREVYKEKKRFIYEGNDKTQICLSFVILSGMKFQVDKTS